MIWSTTNIQNSFAMAVADVAHGKGYAVYYHQSDTLSVPGFVQTDYAMRAAANDFETGVAAFRADSGYRGILTLTDGTSAMPLYATRPGLDGQVPGVGGVAVPVISIDVDPVENGAFWEVGTRIRERTHLAVIAGFVRSEKEQVLWCDTFSIAFEPLTLIDILDHDAGTLDVLGTIEVTHCVVNRQVVDHSASVRAYETVAGLSLWYVA